MQFINNLIIKKNMKKLIFSALVLCSTTRIFYAMETQLESTPSENQWEDILANASERIGALVLGSPEERSAALCLVNASINDLEVNDPKYKEILMEAGLIVALEPNNKTIKLALKTYNSSLNLALDNSHGSNNNEKIEKHIDVNTISNVIFPNAKGYLRLCCMYLLRYCISDYYDSIKDYSQLIKN